MAYPTLIEMELGTDAPGMGSNPVDPASTLQNPSAEAQ